MSDFTRLATVTRLARTEVENERLRESLQELVHAIDNNTGNEPSVSVMHRALSAYKLVGSMCN